MMMFNLNLGVDLYLSVAIVNVIADINIVVIECD